MNQVIGGPNPPVGHNKPRVLRGQVMGGIQVGLVVEYPNMRIADALAQEVFHRDLVLALKIQIGPRLILGQESKIRVVGEGSGWKDFPRSVFDTCGLATFFQVLHEGYT